MSTAPISESHSGSSTSLTWLGLLVGGVGIAGSLHLSLGMGLIPCPLCFYERSFVMAATAVLFVGLFSGTTRFACVAGLALPLAVAGGALAGFHVFLEVSGKLECPAGVGGVGSAPQQSLVALGALAVLLLLATFGSRQPNGGLFGAFVGLVVGATLAYGCVISAPKPGKPTKPYEGQLKGCRPPYVEVETQ